MSNGVHPRQQRGVDSGTQAEPHYCTSRPRPDGSLAGCPQWPDCLFPGVSAADYREQAETERAERLAAVEPDEPEPEDDDEIPALGKTLASLLGFVAGAVLVLVVAAILLPFVV